MSDEALLREKTATLTRMLNLQGTIGMFGHVSVRVPGTDRCFISPGASTEKTHGAAEHMFVYNIDGTIIEHPGGLIPLEWRIHTQIHRDRPDAMCVVHLHAPHARALGIAGKQLKPVFLHGSFLCTGVPTWNNPRLVVNDEQAADLSRPSAGQALRRCAVTARGGRHNRGGSVLLPARSSRRTRRSSFRPRSWAAPSRCTDEEARDCPKAPSIPACSRCCGLSTSRRCGSASGPTAPAPADESCRAA